MVRRSSHLSWVSLLLFWTISVFGSAQRTSAIPAQITGAVSNSQRVSLAGSVSPLVKNAKDLGGLTATRPIKRMVLVLKRSQAQQNELDALVVSQHQKNSASYHKWLTPEQFRDRFAPAPSDIAKVTKWIEGQGFSNVKVARGGQRVEFDGVVSTVESTFQTSMRQFETVTLTGTERHVANATAISIPQALSPVVSGVLSLNDFHSKPLNVAMGLAKRNAQGKLERQTTTTDGYGNFAYYLAPMDIKTIYGGNKLPASVDGSGVSIAVIGRTAIRLSDIQAFRDIFSLPPNDPNIILSGPDPGESYGDLGESSLDLEWAGALAPNATINFVTAASTDTTDGISLAAAYAVDNVVSPIISVSYGSCESKLGPDGNLFMKMLWQQAAAEGISVFVSTGDSGAAGCDGGSGYSATGGNAVNGLASTPYNVAIGGTQFAEGSLAGLYWDSNNAGNLSSAKGYIPENVWNMSCDPNFPSVNFNCSYDQTNYNIEGGGGGASSCSESTVDDSGNVTCRAGYAKPSWQKGVGVPNDSVRDIPDVSLTASPANDPYLVCYAASCEYTRTASSISINQISLVGGTSASTPVMAGIMALVEQKNGTFLGLPNYNLYALAAQAGSSCTSVDRADPSQPASCIFNDITIGNNSAPGLPGYGTDTPNFTATAGYDLATGLGSVNIANLVNNWKSGDSSATTTTTLAAPTTSAKHGVAVPIAVKVASSAGTPTGDIALLSDKYGTAGQYTLGAEGNWIGQVANLPGGTYTLSARYTGDTTYGSSSSEGTSVTITPEGSKPSLVVSTLEAGSLVPITGSHYLGMELYFKGSVAGLSGQGSATGTVDILVDDTTSLATLQLTSDGGYLVESQAVPRGTHAITARYSGDNSFNASVSDPVQVTVGKGQSATYISLYGTAAVGATITLAATISTSGASVVQPTGTGQFYDNGVAVGPAQVIVYSGLQGDSTPQISYQYTITTPGRHVLTSSYSGDDNNDGTPYGADSAYVRVITLDSSPATVRTTTSVTMTSASIVQPGQIARFVVSVKSQDASVTTVPTGSAYLLAQTGDIFYVNPLNNGVLQADAFMYAPGTYKLTARYGGDSTFLTSDSANSVTFTVPKLDPITTFRTSASYALPNTQTTLNFRTFPKQLNSFIQQAGTGTVTFSDAVNGAVPITLGSYTLVQVSGEEGGYSGRFVLPVGSNVITATYSGNAAFNSNSSTAAVIVGEPDFIFTGGQSSLTVSAGTASTASLSIVPVLAYTGTVVLACGTGVPAGSTCTVTPSSTNLTSAQSATVTVTIPAASPSTAAAKLKSENSWKLTGGGFALLAVMLMWVPRRRRMLTWPPAALMLVFSLMWFSGCGDSSTAQQPKATLLFLSSNSIKAVSGSPVTLTATLNFIATAPNGSVTFYDGTAALGSAVGIKNGTAALQTSSLSVGAHQLTAKYSGDENNSVSSSTAITEVITGQTTLQITAMSGSLSHSLPLNITVE